ncbi:hypothetical protein [Arsenicibacter rosenii]|uniref:Uncharacterized protein n=1 Tax=Arsenicibacter rosenii TaxID=1750698 RepID=A0A1S2VHY0_9BACT|nr:hypothetical protein [Arsenicibacter rosenii]OIN58352.1 hypothetical protein BLX24_15275 [Arsenicibacter rosenii]
MARLRPLELVLAGLLTALPIVVFWYVWAQYALNVPKWDDHALKSFLSKLDATTGLAHKVLLFFSQHNEHRIAYDRFITWLDFIVAGKLDFRTLMIIGNLSLLCLAGIFAAILKKQPVAAPTPWVLFLPPVTFLLFNLSQWENMFWGMAALQNFTVALWLFWSIYALCYQNTLFTAVLMAVLATITSGNGLLIWPIGAVLLAQQMRWKQFGYWLGIAAACIGLYFWDYEKPKGNPTAQAGMSAIFKGWLAFNGAAGEALPLGDAFRISLLTGGFLVILTLFLLAQLARKSAKTPFSLEKAELLFIGAAFFLLGTAALVVRSRAGFGLELLITSRYKLYSLMLMVVLYVYGISKTRDWQQKAVGLTGFFYSAALCGFSYPAFLDDTIWWRQWMTTSQFNWTYTNNEPVSTIDAATARWIDNAPAFYDVFLNDLYKPAQGTPAPFISLKQANNQITISDTSFQNQTGKDANTYVLLRSPKRLYLYQTTPTLNSGRKARFGLAPVFGKGFTAQIAEAYLDTATYQLERLIVRIDGRIERHPTGQFIKAQFIGEKDIEKNW